MKFAAIFALMFAAPQAVLTDDVYQVPPGEWRYLEFVLKQQPVAVDCSFQVLPGGPGVRLELVGKQDLKQLSESKPHTALASTAYSTSGVLRLPVGLPGEYAIVIASSKEARGTASVHLRLGLDFSATEPQARYLSPERRWTVIAISFAAFFTIVIVSGRKLFHAMKGAIRL